LVTNVVGYWYVHFAPSHGLVFTGFSTVGYWYVHFAPSNGLVFTEFSTGRARLVCPNSSNENKKSY